MLTGCEEMKSGMQNADRPSHQSFYHNSAGSSLTIRLRTQKEFREENTHSTGGPLKDGHKFSAGGESKRVMGPTKTDKVERDRIGSCHPEDKVKK